MTSKNFRIPASQIKPLVVGKGSCIASDRITVDGQLVGFMYREMPGDDLDSGWRFFAGDESQAYADDQEHFEIYDVNTIANYDPGIVAMLDNHQCLHLKDTSLGMTLGPLRFRHPCRSDNQSGIIHTILCAPDRSLSPRPFKYRRSSYVADASAYPRARSSVPLRDFYSVLPPNRVAPPARAPQ